MPERPTPEPTRLLAPKAVRLFLVEVLMSTVPVAAVLAAAGAAIAVPRIRLARFRYEVREEEIDLRRGIVVRTRTLVPMVRVQHVDTRRTVLSQAFGLAAVVFHTAAGANQIPALREADAAAIRDRITDLARTPEEL